MENQGIARGTLLFQKFNFYHTAGKTPGTATDETGKRRGKLVEFSPQIANTLPDNRTIVKFYVLYLALIEEIGLYWGLG